jgi:hypothetical protein
MRRRYLLASGTVVLLALLGLAGVTLYWKGWPHSTPATLPGPAPAQVSPHTDSFSARNWSYYLRPVPTDQPGARPTAQEAWDNLFPGMAADPSTRELLQRLYGRLPVEFAVLDKEATNDALTQAPGEGFAIALRVANLGSQNKKTADGETLFGLIAIGQATFIKDVVSPPPGESFNDAVGGLIKTMTDRPSDGRAFGLAVEDYMLRHQTGWFVVSGPIFEQERSLPQDPKRHRADLDARIGAFAEKSADYYGKLRGKK